MLGGESRPTASAGKSTTDSRPAATRAAACRVDDVGHHVSAILRKLDVPIRTAAAHRLKVAA